MSNGCPVSRLAVLGVVLFAAGSAAADDKKPPAKSPLDWLRFDESLRTGYLPVPVVFDGARVHTVTLSGPVKDGKVYVMLDSRRMELNLFGDVSGIEPASVKTVVATLKRIDQDDPTKRGRTLYALEAKELVGRLVLVVPGKPAVAAPGQKTESYRLVVLDTKGKPELTADLIRVEPHRPIEPCHPGCFPAGTMVAAPAGPKLIETLRPGDEVLKVTPDGKTAPVKIASVFVGRSTLIEINTDKGVLVTTAKQPLTLVNGAVKGGGELQAGDVLARLKDGKPDPARVRSVKHHEQPSQVFNLVLEERGTFIANGYVVRSKPPPDR